MAVRRCRICLVAEDRKANGDVNLEPVSGLCLRCLVQSTKGPRPMPDLPVDFIKRAAGDLEEA